MGGSGASLRISAGGIPLNSLKAQVGYPERVEYWKQQILAGNNRPILVADNDLTRVIDGNHTLTAYRELGITPQVYSMNRVDFLNGAGSASNTVSYIKEQIQNGTAKRVKIKK